MENIIFRKTRKSDIDAVNQIFTEAKKSIKALNIDQWQSKCNYPNEESILVDIDNDNTYVAVDDNSGEVFGTMVVSFVDELPYNNIRGIGLSNPNSYAVLHRFAVKEEYKGLGVSGFLASNAEEICKNSGVKSLCVDTHRGNVIMQKFALKSGFEFRGEIDILCDGDTLRYVYEKIILPNS